MALIFVLIYDKWRYYLRPGHLDFVPYNEALLIVQPSQSHLALSYCQRTEVRIVFPISAKRLR